MGKVTCVSHELLPNFYKGVVIMFPETLRIEIGIYVDQFIKWLMHTFPSFFDAVAAGVLWFILKMETFMLWLPWWVILIFVFAISWRVIRMLFGMGKVPAVFATIIYAIPPIVRLTDLGIRNVPKEMVEAAHSFGSSKWQTLTKVQLPQALPTIMTGINQTTMMALAMVVVASMIGAKGLGYDVLQAIMRIDIAKGFEAGISIVFLAIIIDRLSQSLGNRFKFPE